MNKRIEKELNKYTIKLQIDKRRDEVLEWLKKLIAFPSENRYPDGFEGEAQNFIESECRNCGFDVDVFLPTDIKDIKKHTYWLSGRTYNNDRKNVVAKWHGNKNGK